MGVDLTFMSWLIVVLHMFIPDEAILFPVAVKDIFAYNVQ